MRHNLDLFSLGGVNVTSWFYLFLFSLYLIVRMLHVKLLRVWHAVLCRGGYGFCWKQNRAMWILCYVFHGSDRKIICRVRVVSQSFFVFRATFYLRSVFCRFHNFYGLEELLKLFAFSRAWSPMMRPRLPQQRILQNLRFSTSSRSTMSRMIKWRSSMYQDK